MPLALAEYEYQIGHHLRMIEHHSKSLRSHAERMTAQPSWETLAEDELAKCDASLAKALGEVHQALETFRGKPRDS